MHTLTPLTDLLCPQFPHTEEREWRRQSQSVQRHLPRPVDVNTTILRGAPHKDQKYRALYEAEELIKQEMLVMMQHDLVHLPPPPASNGGLQVSKATMNRTRQELEKNPKANFTDEELEQVSGWFVFFTRVVVSL